MEYCSKKLKIAGIINILLGIITVLPSPLYGIFMLITGFILYTYSNENYEGLTSKKTILVIIALIMLITNIVSAILILLVTDKLEELRHKGFTGPPKRKLKQKIVVIDPEVKRIDILLKLGVGMVFVSGILFATTTWEIITNPIKALVLILMGTLFLGLSSFSDKKLKLEKTTFMYWILSMSFYLLTWIGIGYFGLINEWFTFSGGGHDLVYMITFLIVSALSYLTYKKFNKQELLYIVYAGLLISVYNLFSFVNVLEIIKILVINILVFITYIISNKNTILNKFSKTIIYLTIIGIINALDNNPILVLVSSLVNITSLFYIMYKNENEEENILILLLNYILIVISIMNLDIKEYQGVLVVLLTSIETLLFRFKILSKSIYADLSNQVLYTICTFIMFLTSITATYEEICLISDLYLIISLLSSFNWNKDNSNIILKYTQPIAVAFVVASGAFYLDIHCFDVTFAGFSLITSVIYCFMNLLVKDKQLKNEYFIALVLLTLLSTMVNLFQNDFLLSIVTILTPAYIFCYNYLVLDNNEGIINISFIYLLLSIFLSITINEIISTSVLINNIIVIWIFCVLMFFLKDEKTLTKIANISLVLPMYNIIQYTNFEYTIKLILSNILQFYVLYIIVRFFCEKTETKNIVSIIGIVFIILQVIFQIGIITGLYVGIIGILIIIIGFYNKKNNSLFITGIIITIINIIFQLQDLWQRIPFYLYLLICGLGIIGFVTYKEMKKINKK